MSKQQERLAVFAFGVIFVIVMLVLAVKIPNPTPNQYETFKIVLALAAAGVAAFIPGFLAVNVSKWLRAGGALAVFAIVFFQSPATLVTNPGWLSLEGWLGDRDGNCCLEHGQAGADGACWREACHQGHGLLRSEA